MKRYIKFVSVYELRKQHALDKKYVIDKKYD